MNDKPVQSINTRGYLETPYKLFHLRDQIENEFDYHYHDFNKIIVFISGTVSYLIEGKSYNLKPWDILFISHSQVHKPVIDPKTVYERIVIWFDPSFVTRYNSSESNLLTCFELASKRECNLLRLSANDLNTVRSLLAQLEADQQNDEFGSDILSGALMVQLVIYLNRYFLKSEQLGDSIDIQYDKTVQSVINYINTHLDGNLSIDGLADLFYVSKYHLMRKFKLQTGYSIHRYVLQKRLILGRQMIEEGRSAMDTCLNIGFKDYSSFVRAFKKEFGLSPKNYYKKFYKR